MPAPNNAASLKDVKDKLYKVFNRDADTYDSTYDADSRHKLSERLQSTAKCIASLEHEVEVLDLLKAVRDEGGSITLETGPDGMTKIGVLSPIRLRPPGSKP